jgi:hypothetical protein
MFGAFSSSDVRTSDTIKSMLSLTIRSKKLTVGFENSSSKYPLKTDVSKYADLIIFKGTRSGHQIPVAQFPSRVEPASEDNTLSWRWQRMPVLWSRVGMRGTGIGVVFHRINRPI